MLLRESLEKRLDQLTQPETVFLDNLLTGKLLWVPLPGPQLEAYLCPADVLFYGGAAGGGKTDLLLGLATTAHLKSIIFRREYTQLPELVERSGEILSGSGARYNGQNFIWANIPGGRKLEFGATKQERFKEKFKGRPHDLKAFDEICDFTESGFRFIIGWTRTTVVGQRVRIVCTGNPPTQPEGDWVIRYWAPWLDSQHSNQAVPGELRYFASLEGEDVEVEGPEAFEHNGETIVPLSRTFIPARLKDNPYLERTGYRAQLQALPEPLRSKLLFGDFTAEIAPDPWQLIRPASIRKSWARWEQQGPDSPLTVLIVDPARGGKDEMVIGKRYGNWVAPLETHPGRTVPDGATAANLVIEALGDNADAEINVDVIGIGSSVYDILKGKGLNVNAVNFSEKSFEVTEDAELGFVNLRAELYWRVRASLLTGEHSEQLLLPPDNTMLMDLTAVHWEMKTRGIQIEPKKAIRKKLGRSPGRGDVIAMSFYQGSQGVFFS